VEAADSQNVGEAGSAPAITPILGNQVSSTKGEGGGHFRSANPIDVRSCRSKESVGELVADSWKKAAVSLIDDEALRRGHEQGRAMGSTNPCQNLDHRSWLWQFVRSCLAPNLQAASPRELERSFLMPRSQNRNPGSLTPPARAPPLDNHDPGTNHRFAVVDQSSELEVFADIEKTAAADEGKAGEQPQLG
jgi:hypothetical protein